MPELPEVETTCRGLAKVLIRKKITNVTTRRSGLRIPFPADLSKNMHGTRVRSVTRRGKYICINLSNGYVLVIHLGMSGRIIIADRHYEPKLHDHFIISFSRYQKIILNDPRRFGLVTILKSDELEYREFFRNIGLEPLSDNFTPDLLRSKLKNKKIAIKLALLDQKVVSGIGNIYACEALFRAGISPKRESSAISYKLLSKLVNSIKLVLTEAIEAGGSTIRDFVHPDGKLGYFAMKWQVYGREGEPCLCNHQKNIVIKRIVQSGRSTFFCPICQR
ncbi:MAG: bifunctional DNA-formamidopyrimidine glycosylase/DNA-(apurinic or apyrimidinic site) lyase [Pseudomonadota bacterium]|nr:bifunctional DNA-formamidopyrimidine glycosylase/DNA-(apurinic or apyrimidinic site) lyase [Pseudomonadota bacterium]